MPLQYRMQGGAGVEFSSKAERPIKSLGQGFAVGHPLTGRGPGLEGGDTRPPGQGAG